MLKNVNFKSEPTHTQDYESSTRAFFIFFSQKKEWYASQ